MIRTVTCTAQMSGDTKPAKAVWSYMSGDSLMGISIVSGRGSILANKRRGYVLILAASRRPVALGELP